MMALATREMVETDVPTVADIHVRGFPGFFLTFLGGRFLRQLYLAIVADPSGIAFVFDEGRGIAGFVAGSSDASGLYSRLLRGRWWAFAAAALPAAIRRPTIVPRLVRALAKPHAEMRPPGTGMLMSLCVDPGAQRGGVGKSLVEAFLGEARRRGLHSVVLDTDAEGNDAVNAFYGRQGFVLVRRFRTPEGREMNECVREL
jgi:ribosomal protein S18 acetylase RimI-like enzyme